MLFLKTFLHSAGPVLYGRAAPFEILKKNRRFQHLRPIATVLLPQIAPFFADFRVLVLHLTVVKISSNCLQQRLIEHCTSLYLDLCLGVKGH